METTNKLLFYYLFNLEIIIVISNTTEIFR